MDYHIKAWLDDIPGCCVILARTLKSQTYIVHTFYLYLIVSNDSITMNPPYEITPSILKLITSISQKIGEVNAKHLVRQNPKLRKQNQIKTIYSLPTEHTFKEQITIEHTEKLMHPLTPAFHLFNLISLVL